MQPQEIQEIFVKMFGACFVLQIMLHSGLHFSKARTEKGD